MYVCMLSMHPGTAGRIQTKPGVGSLLFQKVLSMAGVVIYFEDYFKRGLMHEANQNKVIVLLGV